jgi:hypothetical protein
MEAVSRSCTVKRGGLMSVPVMARMMDDYDVREKVRAANYGSLEGRVDSALKVGGAG